MRANNKVNIKTPLAITEEQKNEIEKFFVVNMGKNVQISYEIEPGLIGGLVFEIGSKKLDLSTKGKLENIKKYLQK